MPEIPPLIGPGWDFDVFWYVGREVLIDGEPYSVIGSLYPPAALIPFAVMALIPRRLGFGIWILVQIVILMKLVSPKKALLWIFYMPVLLVIAAGQLDLALLFIATSIYRPTRAPWHAPVLAAAITIKPQVAFVLLPWLLVRWTKAAVTGVDRRALPLFLTSVSALHLVPALLFGWDIYAAWFNAASGFITTSAQVTPGLFSLVVLGVPWPILALLAFPLAILFWILADEPTARTANLLALPVGHYYSSVLMTDLAPWWFMIPLSWLALLMAHIAGAFYPLVMIPLGVLGWRYKLRLEANVPAARFV